MRIFRSIVSLSLAILVLVSSTSFTVGLHVCRGHVKDIAVMQDARPCAMELMAAELGLADDDCGMSAKMGCCENRTLAFDGNDYQYKTPTKVTLPDATATPALSPCPTAFAFPEGARAYTSFVSYKPPLLHRDVTVLVQRFLI